MPELSNLLRQRLGAAEAEGKALGPVHPDEDTLTAYVEQLLPADERQKVLTHIAACGACRDVVALSLPQSPEPATQQVFAPTPVSRWRRLFTPAFGLAASVAAVAVIAVVVLQAPHPRQMRQPAQPAQEAKAPSLSNEKALDERAANENKPALTAQPEAPVHSASEADVTRRKDREEATRAATVAGLAALTKTAPRSVSVGGLSGRQSDAAMPQPVLTAELKKKDFVNTSLFAANSGEVASVDGWSSNDYPAAPQPQPSASAARFPVNSPGQITAFSDIPANPSGNKSQARLLTPPPPPERFGCPVLCKIVEKGAHSVFHRTPGSAPAIGSGTLSFSAMGGPGKFSSELQKNQAAEAAAAPEKPANEGLEQSYALSARARSSSGAAQLESAAAWKVAGGKLMRLASKGQWEEVYPAASIQFSFVNARGDEVWAGGANAYLIHSLDGGAAWETVKLGDAAAGTIISIIFGARNVLVKTSDDQSWSSSDGGKSWTRQDSEK